MKYSRHRQLLHALSFGQVNPNTFIRFLYTQKKTQRILRGQSLDFAHFRERVREKYSHKDSHTHSLSHFFIPLSIVISMIRDFYPLISSSYLSAKSYLELGIIGAIPQIQEDLVACSWQLNLLIWWLDGEKICYSQLLTRAWRT